MSVKWLVGLELPVWRYAITFNCARRMLLTRLGTTTALSRVGTDSIALDARKVVFANDRRLTVFRCEGPKVNFALNWPLAVHWSGHLTMINQTFIWENRQYGNCRMHLPCDWLIEFATGRLLPVITRFSMFALLMQKLAIFFHFAPDYASFQRWKVKFPLVSLSCYRRVHATAVRKVVSADTKRCKPNC